MVDQQIITPVTEAMYWISSLIFLQKSNGSLCICSDPYDFNKVIIQLSLGGMFFF